jgi:hypothetical protein
VKTAQFQEDKHKVTRHKIRKGFVSMSCSCGWPGPPYDLQEVFADAVEMRHLVMVEQESFE